MRIGGAQRGEQVSEDEVEVCGGGEGDEVVAEGQEEGRGELVELAEERIFLGEGLTVCVDNLEARRAEHSPDAEDVLEQGERREAPELEVFVADEVMAHGGAHHAPQGASEARGSVVVARLFGALLGP